MVEVVVDLICVECGVNTTWKACVSKAAVLEVALGYNIPGTIMMVAVLVFIS